MSKAYKCDRCGKLFEEYQKPKNGFVIWRAHKEHYAEPERSLCPECQKSLIDWWKEGANGSA